MTCPFCRAEHPAGTAVCPKTGQRLTGLLPSGTVIDDKYRITGLLGTGGMAAVYKAEHTKIGRTVAVKLLLPEFVAFPELVQRVEREARAAGGVDHQNVVEIVDLGTTPTFGPYIAMELLKGEDLATFAEKRGGKLPPYEAVEITRQVLAALHAAHLKGVVHRDLKPENIFLCEDDDRLRVKVLDFGISKLAAEEKLTSLTRAGTVLGTPQFMSPEQAAGAREQDARVDIYSAGVVLYALLTGLLPYEAENYNLLINDILNKPPRPILTRDPTLDPALANAVMRALQRDPNARFATAKDMAEALSAWLDWQDEAGGKRGRQGTNPRLPAFKFKVGAQGAAEIAPPTAKTMSLPVPRAPAPAAPPPPPPPPDEDEGGAIDDEPTTSFEIPVEREDRPPPPAPAPAIGAPPIPRPPPNAPMPMPAAAAPVMRAPDEAMSLSQLMPIQDALKMAYASTDAQRAAKSAIVGGEPMPPEMQQHGGALAPGGLPNLRSNTRTPLGWENTPAGTAIPPAKHHGRTIAMALGFVIAASAGAALATREFAPLRWNNAVRTMGLGGLMVSEVGEDPRGPTPTGRPEDSHPTHNGHSNSEPGSSHDHNPSGTTGSPTGSGPGSTHGEEDTGTGATHTHPSSSGGHTRQGSSSGHASSVRHAGSHSH